MEFVENVNPSYYGLPIFDESWITSGTNAYLGTIRNSESDLHRIDLVHGNRRPRKLLTPEFQRWVFRQCGYILEGDYSRVRQLPRLSRQYEIPPAYTFEGKLLRIRWYRRQRALDCGFEKDIKSFNVRWL